MTRMYVQRFLRQAWDQLQLRLPLGVIVNVVMSIMYISSRDSHVWVPGMLCVRCYI